MQFLITVGGLCIVFIRCSLAATVRPTHGPPANGLHCPPGNWTLNGESCYYFRRETYNWFDSKVVCKTINSKLAEVQTAEEEEFLVSVINQTYGFHQYVWLGLQDFKEEGEWVWSSNQQPAQLTFWNAGEPQDRNGAEDCAGIVGGGWFDANCEHDHYTFVCETDARRA